MLSCIHLPQSRFRPTTANSPHDSATTNSDGGKNNSNCPLSFFAKTCGFRRTAAPKTTSSPIRKNARSRMRSPADQHASRPIRAPQSRSQKLYRPGTNRKISSNIGNRQKKT